MLAHLAQAFSMVFEPYTILVMVLASLFGLFVGAVPGLTATMATALLVPVTFFMPPIPAIAAIVTATAMAIFSGDIPGALLRIPGTPASAAYTDEAFAMTKKGRAELALGAGLVFSAIGGLFGTAVLIVAAPALADIALRFSSFEYFWLVLLGLTCAVFITSDRPLKGLITLFLGLLVACVGLGNPAGHPRFTFGNSEMMGGIGFIPMMIGMFAVSEIIRFAVDTRPPARARRREGRQHLRRPVGTREEVLASGAARQLTRHIGRRVAGRRRGYRGLDVVRRQQEIFEGASEVRHRSRRRHRRIGRRQQQRAGGRMDSRARVRYSGRFDHRHRDRGAVHEEHESGADAVHRQPAEHLCGVHPVHHRQHHHGAARHPVHQGCQADPQGAAPRVDAIDSPVLHRRHVCDQQLACSISARCSPPA